MLPPDILFFLVLLGVAFAAVAVALAWAIDHAMRSLPRVTRWTRERE